jgi:hypothetical protein
MFASCLVRPHRRIRTGRKRTSILRSLMKMSKSRGRMIRQSVAVAGPSLTRLTVQPAPLLCGAAFSPQVLFWSQSMEYCKLLMSALIGHHGAFLFRAVERPVFVGIYVRIGGVLGHKIVPGNRGIFTLSLRSWPMVEGAWARRTCPGKGTHTLQYRFLVVRIMLSPVARSESLASIKYHGHTTGQQ